MFSYEEFSIMDSANYKSMIILEKVYDGKGDGVKD